MCVLYGGHELPSKHFSDQKKNPLLCMYLTKAFVDNLLL